MKLDSKRKEEIIMTNVYPSKFHYYEIIYFLNIYEMLFILKINL